MGNYGNATQYNETPITLMSLLIARTKFSDFSDDAKNAKNSTRNYYLLKNDYCNEYH